jgi:hypothetical protein
MFLSDSRFRPVRGLSLHGRAYNGPMIKARPRDFSTDDFVHIYIHTILFSAVRYFFCMRCRHCSFVRFRDDPDFPPAVGHFQEKNYPSTFHDCALIKEQKTLSLCLAIFVELKYFLKNLFYPSLINPVSFFRFG